jgi:lipid A ethanolaminephosphotransferase
MKSFFSRLFRPTISTEALLSLVIVYWILICNQSFFSSALSGKNLTQSKDFLFLVCLCLILFSIHGLIFGLFLTKKIIKPVLGFLSVGTAFAVHFVDRYGVYLNADMLRNTFHTDVAEAKELISFALWSDVVFYAAIPIFILWWCRLSLSSGAVLADGKRGFIFWLKRFWLSFRRRLFFLLGCFLVLCVSLALIFQPFASLMRQHSALRHQILPAAYLWAIGQVGVGKSLEKPKEPIGLDAKWQDTSFKTNTKPLVIFLVVGETARAMNWGLNGYERNTTPLLAKQSSVINFTQVSSCGTDTETSVPCMFSPWGRHQYDRSLIRGSESLLHILNRVGIPVVWRDNQSGCKGVCDGLTFEKVNPSDLPATICQQDRCFDEGLLFGLDQRLKNAKGVQVVVFHQLGNHGPSYFRRYPPAFAQFKPVCEKDDLGQCDRQAIVNAYDNAILYTDFVLNQLISTLKQHQKEVDTLVWYVSDHGESLGENGLFLHGVPFSIAPKEQTRVPMIMWASDKTYQRLGVQESCLQSKKDEVLSHDHLFHSVLGMLHVQTELYDTQWDITHGCRKN